MEPSPSVTPFRPRRLILPFYSYHDYYSPPNSRLLAPKYFTLLAHRPPSTRAGRLTGRRTALLHKWLSKALAGWQREQEVSYLLRLNGAIVIDIRKSGNTIHRGFMTRLCNYCDPGKITATRWISLLIILLFAGMAYASPAASSNASSYSNGPTDEKELAAFMDGVVSAQIIAYNIPGARQSKKD